MLDQNTKKIIDSARDVLVGKLPAPNTQVSSRRFQGLQETP